MAVLLGVSLWPRVTANKVTRECESKTTGVYLGLSAIGCTEMPGRMEVKVKTSFCVYNGEKQLDKCPIKQQ